MPVALYTALATSASVFIGILAAFLASNVANLNAERNRIKRRLETIHAKRGSLQDKKDKLQDQIDAYRDQQEAAAGEDEDRTLTLHNIGGSGITTEMDVGPSIPEEQMDVQRDLHAEQQYNQDWRQLLQTNTDLAALDREKNRLEDQYDVLDPSQTTDMLRASGIAILVSVVVPIIALFFTVLSAPTVNLPSWIEPALVSVLWACGLGYVFIHLWNKITADTDDFPSTGAEESN